MTHKPTNRLMLQHQNLRSPSSYHKPSFTLPHSLLKIHNPILLILITLADPTRPASIPTYDLGVRAVAIEVSDADKTVMLPMNDPVYGTMRKSQIQTYLEHNEGAGVQHLALVSEDIFRTLREMRQRSGIGGFDFMPSPPPTYYKRANVLTDERPREGADDDGYDGDVVDGQRGTEMVAELATEVRAFVEN